MGKRTLWFKVLKKKRHFDVDPEENEVLKKKHNNRGGIRFDRRWKDDCSNVNIYTSEKEKVGLIEQDLLMMTSHLKLGLKCLIV